MKVSRGKPVVVPASSQTSRAIEGGTPRLRVGVPGKTYTPAERREAVPNDAPNDDAERADAYAQGGTNARNEAATVPMAGNPSDQGLRLDKRWGWVCKYQCGFGPTNVDGIAAHSYQCPYWQNEGRDKTPF